MDNEWLFEHLAAIALEDGDLRPLIKRVEARKTLTDAEWQVIQKVLEAAAAGRSWRPPHRRKACDRAARTRAYSVLFQYQHQRIFYGLTDKQAVHLVGQMGGHRLRERSVRASLAAARSDPGIMSDPAIAVGAAVLEDPDFGVVPVRQLMIKHGGAAK